jgi:hypothetical protein
MLKMLQILCGVHIRKKSYILSSQKTASRQPALPRLENVHLKKKTSDVKALNLLDVTRAAMTNALVSESQFRAVKPYFTGSACIVSTFQLYLLLPLTQSGHTSVLGAVQLAKARQRLCSLSNENQLQSVVFLQKVRQWSDDVE